jgi:hypothetical protein
MYNVEVIDVTPNKLKNRSEPRIQSWEYLFILEDLPDWRPDGYKNLIAEEFKDRNILDVEQILVIVHSGDYPDFVGSSGIFTFSTTGSKE